MNIKDELRVKLNAMPDWEVFARCLWGEAEGQGTVGMMEIASVIMNRLKKPKRFGAAIKDVLLTRWQFSCFEELPRLQAIMETDILDPIMITAIGISTIYMAGRGVDIVSGADHYEALPPSKEPKWAKDSRYKKVMSSTSGHEFYVENLA